MDNKNILAYKIVAGMILFNFAMSALATFLIKRISTKLILCKNHFDFVT